MIEDLPSCAELIGAIMRDAETGLAADGHGPFGINSFGDRDVRLAAALARGDQAVTAGAGRAGGVAEGERAAAHVDRGQVGAGLALPGQVGANAVLRRTGTALAQ